MENGKFEWVKTKESSTEIWKKYLCPFVWKSSKSYANEYYAITSYKCYEIRFIYTCRHSEFVDMDLRKEIFLRGRRTDDVLSRRSTPPPPVHGNQTCTRVCDRSTVTRSIPRNGATWFILDIKYTRAATKLCFFVIVFDVSAGQRRSTYEGIASTCPCDEKNILIFL